MRTLTAAPGRPTTHGRWIWAVSGLATMGLLAVPAAVLIVNAGNGGNGQVIYATPTRTTTVTVSQAVTSLNVASYGAPIQVTARPVHRVTVTEAISSAGPGNGTPTVTDTVSQGRLTLAAPACASMNSNCSVGFTVTVPSGVAVTAASDSGDISVFGAAGANLDSGGGNVYASQIDGPLTISSEDGNINVADIASATVTNLDSGGGNVQAARVHSPLTVTSEDGTINVIGVASATVTNLDSGGGNVYASQIDGPLSVTSEDGLISVGGVSAPAGTNLNSGGGPIQASRVDGPLSIVSEDGDVTVNGLTGDLSADTGGGQFSGDGVAAERVSVATEDGSAVVGFSTAPGYVLVDTGGGSAQLTFDQAPTTVLVNTENGPATLNVPGGPYSVSATSDGGPLTVNVATSAAAHRSLTVNSGGGPLDIGPR